VISNLVPVPVPVPVPLLGVHPVGTEVTFWVRIHELPGSNPEQVSAFSGIFLAHSCQA
jgi:hypothetical protein